MKNYIAGAGKMNGNVRNVHKTEVVKPDGKPPLAKPGHKWNELGSE
jgi:hypothetical protein